MAARSHEKSRFPDLVDRRLIFSINSGRAGSKYLAQLLGTARSVESFHEAEPKMSGEFMSMINSAPMAASRDQRRIKADAIAAILRSKPGAIYAETNHAFIKTFFDVVLDDFPSGSVINLRRDLPLVLKSFVELGYFSPLNPLSFSWMSSPNAATAALPAIGPDSSLDQFDLCIAYLLDIEARAARFREEYPEVPLYEVRLEELNRIEFVEEFFNRLHLVPTAATREVVGQSVNERRPRKEKIGNPATMEECQRRLAEYLKKAKARGINVPEIAQ